MEEYLIDRPILEGIVDAVLSTIDLSGKTDDEKSSLRENGIKKLDHNIGLAIASKFSEEKLTVFNELLDDMNTSKESFLKFFEENGVDIGEVAKEEIVRFKDEFAKEVQDAK